MPSPQPALMIVMKTLKDIIHIRETKYDKTKNASMSDFWQGYEEGWRSAYRDLREILSQFHIDTDSIVVIQDND